LTCPYNNDKYSIFKELSYHYIGEINMPFCPKCKAEYNPTITSCYHCEVELVPSLPDPDKILNEQMENAELVHIATVTMNEAKKIETFLKDNLIACLISMDDGCKTGCSRTQFATFQLLVPEVKASEAVALLKTRWNKIDENKNDDSAGSEIKVKTYKKNSNYKYHYSFQAKSISAFEEEPFMPIGEDILPKVEISSTKNWKAVKDWYSKNTEKTIDNDKNIVSITSSLVAGKTNKDQIIRDIYHWIIENIRYVGVHLGDSDFIPHRASQTLKNKYGDCKDKSTLLISMLRLAGFKAYHVLLSTQATSQADEGLPSLSAFDHMITLVLLNGKKIWLDPTPSFENYGYLHYGDQDRSALIISPEFPSSLIRTPSLDYKASGSFIHYSIFGQNGILISPI